MNAKTKTAASVLAIILGMIMLAYASVPLYKIFCQVTGFGGTPGLAIDLPTKVLDREITVRFNADVDKKLRWEFQPLQTDLTLRIGEVGVAFFVVRNLTHLPLVGMATYNVTPLKVGNHFNKVECFCFTDQIVAAGQERVMPVTFFISPDLADDSLLNDIKTVTLSYTFFPSEHQVSKYTGFSKTRALHRGEFYQ
jgi:cytochrome c oxidase assembly protein subunit 11